MRLHINLVLTVSEKYIIGLCLTNNVQAEHRLGNKSDICGLLYHDHAARALLIQHNNPLPTLCREVRTPPYEYPWYDTKQSDDEASVMLCGMRISLSLPSIPGSLWHGVVATYRVLSMDRIGLNWVLMLNWMVWNRTVLIFNCVWTKTIHILNWIGWIRTVCLNWIARNRSILTITLYTRAQLNYLK